MLGELTWCRHLPLRGLPRHDVARLVAETSGVELSDHAAETLRAATDGNPFFIREIATLLPGEKCLTSPTWRRRTSPCRAEWPRWFGGASTACPHPASACWKPPPCWARNSTWTCSASSLASPSEQAAEAVRTRLLTTVSGTPARLQFVHALVRQILCSRLAPTRRAELHARAAEAIVLRHQHDLTPRLAELAHHLWEAGTDPVQTVHYTVEAGHTAMHTLAYEEAAGHFSRAVMILESSAPGSAVRRCDVLLLLADAELAAGNATAARDTIKAAALLAQRAGAPRPARARRTDRGHCRHLQHPRRPGSRPAASRAEGTARKQNKAAGPSARTTAKALVLTSDLERRTRLADEAVAIAQRTGDPEVLGWVLLDRHVAIWGFAPTPERLGIATKIIHLAEEIHDSTLLACGHILRMANLLELGEVVDCSAEIDVFDQVIREHRMTELRWLVPLLRATAANIAGRLAEAERLAEKGRAMGRRIIHPGLDIWYQASRFFEKFWQGRGEEVASLVRRLIDETPHVPALRTGLATILVQTGRMDEAAVELERQAADRFSQVPRDFTG
ncbi:tetratricopeptide repeat protein [Amycolatopsis sp. A133]|uniref:tetratricopeptide repeat protein n=1 Tax=Amycolatopsis sp. A133 TaxID=3064472 RepID=UPI0027EBAE14|nr:tetratricopeptide repeat protein [Amycolatopsis sp. A133]MDQ7806445.1 tetratricopeptide repeat protein [Amycolatopsis sp. A133]